MGFEAWAAIDGKDAVAEASSAANDGTAFPLRFRWTREALGSCAKCTIDEKKDEDGWRGCDEAALKPERWVRLQAACVIPNMKTGGVRERKA